MVDPRRPDAFELVEAAAAAGLAGIKFHPYELNLADYDFPQAIAVAQHAAARGLWCAVCCSYGRLHVYDVSGVRLVIALAKSLRSPIIALHGGGRQVLDVMSIAAEAPNILIETSFSLPFWRGSSVEMDFAFAMRKLGAQRWLFGSDHPYMPMRQSREDLLDFLQTYKFSETDVEQIMSGTARALFNR
ncbi:Amidohydrolase [compost metagenome]